MPGVLVLVIIAFLSNGGAGLIKRLFDHNSVPAGVTNAVDSYYDAVAAQDVPNAESYVCTAQASTWLAAQETSSGDTKRSITDHAITAKSKTGANYTVTVDVTAGGSTSRNTVTVVPEDDSYKVCSGIDQ